MRSWVRSLHDRSVTVHAERSHSLAPMASIVMGSCRDLRTNPSIEVRLGRHLKRDRFRWILIEAVMLRPVSPPRSIRCIGPFHQETTEGLFQHPAEDLLG